MPMDLPEKVLVIVHLLGLAAVFGGALVQIRAAERVVNHAMLDGVLLQIVSGVMLVGVLEGDGSVELSTAQIGVKFTVALVVALLCWANRRKPAVPDGLFVGIVGLTLANVGIAVFW
jgi:hypothetical protein